MNIAAARQPSTQHYSKTIQYIPQFQLIANINGALQAYEAVAPKLSDDRIGTSLKNIASCFVLAKNVDSNPRKYAGIDFHKTMRRAEHELSNLFREKALADNEIASKAHQSFTAALIGSAYDVR